MDVISIIKQRRSVRVFEDKIIHSKDIQTILECAMCAPTARNQQGFRFIVVDDKEILNNISQNLQHGKMCKTASHAIVVCYEIKDESSELYWQQDASAATQNILLSSASLGIGSAWIAVYPRYSKVEFVSRLFNLPHNFKPLCIVALGYKQNILKEVNRFDSSKVWHNTIS
jgi:nitroreductase